MPRFKIEHVIKTWGIGTQSALEPELIKDGGFSDSSNFIAEIDRVELIGGRKLVGSEVETAYPCLGLHSIQQQNGNWVMLRKNHTALQVYDTGTNDWVNIKTGLLANEELYFDNSFTPAGRQILACGQDGLLKIYPSAPSNVIDLTDPVKNYKGKILIEKSRMITIRMKEDPTGIRLSKIDKDLNYTAVTSEAVSSATASHYTGTLAHTQIFGVVFTKGSQILRDDKNGILTGDGTGTINYATGAYVLDFTTSNATAVTAAYLWENPLVNGIADFTFSGSRLAGEGNVLRQDATGTKSNIVIPFNNSYFTLQDSGSWCLKINSKDDDFDNQIYNTKVSCSSTQGGVQVSDGIIFIDSTEENKPKLRKLSLNDVGDKVIPTELSDLFKFDGYVFDQSPMIQFNDFIFFSGKSEGAQNNDTSFIYSLKNKGIVKVPGGYKYFTVADKKLYGGDALSPNVYQLFSEYDDLGKSIEGYFISNNTNLDTEQIKKVKIVELEGYLSGTQGGEIWLSFDKENFIKFGSFDKTNAMVLSTGSSWGSIVYGDDVYGGEEEIEVSWFKVAIKINTPKFERLRYMIVPTGLGLLGITQVKFSDIRLKGYKILKKYKQITK